MYSGTRVVIWTGLSFRINMVKIIYIKKKPSYIWSKFGSSLSLFRSMEFSIKFDTVKSGWSIVYIEG